MNDELETTMKDCSVISNSQLANDRRIRIVPQWQEGFLTDKHLLDYHKYRKNLLSYLLQIGKNPEKAQGYSPYTVYADSYRQSAFDLWLWERDGEYNVPPTRHEPTRTWTILRTATSLRPRKEKHRRRSTATRNGFITNTVKMSGSSNTRLTEVDRARRIHRTSSLSTKEERCGKKLLIPDRYRAEVIRPSKSGTSGMATWRSSLSGELFYC